MDGGNNVGFEEIPPTHPSDFVIPLSKSSLDSHNITPLSRHDHQHSLNYNGSNDSIDTLYVGYGKSASLSNETLYPSSDAITDRFYNVNTSFRDKSRYIYDRAIYLSNIQKRKSFSNTYIKRAQFYKTKICLWHLNGRCFMGEDCNYAHSFSELKENPDLRKTTLCTELKQKLTCTNPACPYAHSQKELRANNFLFKTSVCKFWKYGRCPAGSTCRYAHGFEEVRNPLEVFKGPLCRFNNNKSELSTSQNSFGTKSMSPMLHAENFAQESVQEHWNQNDTICRITLQSTDTESDLYSRMI